VSVFRGRGGRSRHTVGARHAEKVRRGGVIRGVGVGRRGCGGVRGGGVVLGGVSFPGVLVGRGAVQSLLVGVKRRGTQPVLP